MWLCYVCDKSSEHEYVYVYGDMGMCIYIYVCVYVCEQVCVYKYDK